MAAQNTDNTVIASEPPLRGGSEPVLSAVEVKQSVLLSPKLRFKEFDGEWKKIKFGKLAEFKNGLNFGKEQEGTGLKVIGVGDFKNHMSISYDSLSKVNIPESHKEAYLLKDNDLLFVRSNGNKDLIGRALFLNKVKEEIGYSGFTIRARFNQGLEIHPYFYAIFFKSAAPKKQFLLLGGGTNISNLNQQILAGLEMPKPTLPEQQKIAAFLSAVDKKIQQLTKKKELLEEYKKGVMQQLFSRKISFTPSLEDFKDDLDQGMVIDIAANYPDWEETQLSEVAKRITRKNKENNLNVLTISAQQGLISQLEYFNKSVSAKNVTNYYLLKKDEFAYNKSYSTGYPMGAIKRLIKYDKGVVSTLYICFAFNEKVSLAFMEQYFKFGRQNIELEKVAQEGARNHGLLNIGVNDFFNIDLKIPCIEEQQKIANYLSAIDAKIEGVNQQIEKTQTFKKGLLQQMFV